MYRQSLPLFPLAKMKGVTLLIVQAHMSHITHSCILSVKIDFSLDSASKYHEDQDQGLHFFIGRENGPKWQNPRWPPTYIIINIFANNFATTYATDINNMSILMFSGMRKQILSLVLKKNIVKSIFIQI